MLLPRLCAIAAVALMLPFYAVVAAHQVAADQGTTRPSLQQAAEALWNPTVSAYSSYEDEGAGELQKDSLCLRAVNLCGFAGGARNDVTCCGQHGQHMTVRDGLAPTTAGYCQIGAAGGPTVTNGFFRSSSIQCRLTRDVAKCGLDNCGDLVLWGEGEARQFSYVVIEGPLPQFTDGTCPRSPGSGFRQVTPLLAVDNTTQQLLDAAKQAGREAEARGEPVVNIGQFAYFYSGPITVQSRKSTSKWQHGWFTYAAIVSSITTNEQGLAKLEAENGPLPRVTAQDFNTFRFELYRDQEGF